MQSKFIWNELLSSNTEQDKKFYKDLFNWEYEEKETPYGVYTLCKFNGDFIGGIMQAPAGVTASFWLGYVGVENITESFNSAIKLGATEVVAPMHIPEVGEIAVIKDKSNSTIGLFQPDMSKQKDCK